MSLDDLLATREARIIPDAIDRALAAELRIRFERAGYTRYGLVDRGSYDYVDDPVAPELAALIERHASGLSLSSARALRLAPGDYLLARHDRARTGRSLEVVLDVSPASTFGAEVHYRQHGQVFCRIPAVPGTLALVPANPTVTCNHTYVSKLARDAQVVRWIAVYVSR